MQEILETASAIKKLTTKIKKFTTKYRKYSFTEPQVTPGRRSAMMVTEPLLRELEYPTS